MKTQQSIFQKPRKNQTFYGQVKLSVLINLKNVRFGSTFRSGEIFKILKSLTYTVDMNSDVKVI